MRGIRSFFCVAVIAASGFAPPAFAGNPADCHKPPPAWYTAPRVTHTYSVSYGAGYSRASRASPRYSAARRSYQHAANRW